jgi:CheY-like chemotaxis protein
MARILIIDDNEDLCFMTAELLRSAGHTVDTADVAKAGLEACKAGVYDLVITDIVMPEMDGLELIEELRHTAPRPRVIAISGASKLSESLYLPVAKRLGAERILAKPLRPDILLQTVADVLSKPAPITETDAPS